MIKKYLLLSLSYSVLMSANAQAEQEKMKPQDTEFWQPQPKIVTPYPVPSDAKVLFNGSNLDHWLDGSGEPAKWTVKNGELIGAPSKGLVSKESFCDMQLHVEWRTPKLDEKRTSQQRGNSGVFLQGRYEIQVLDNYQNETYVNGQAGSVYKQTAPLVNASLPPQVWQTYDIMYKAPTFDDNGKVKTKAYVTVLHNGVLVQNNTEIQGSTVYVGNPSYKAHGCAPIKLQYHGNEVAYRNIWVREL